MRSAGQVALEVEHGGRVPLGEEPGDGREEVDFPQGCATAEHAEVGEQEPSDIQPLESALPGRGAGFPGREEEVEAVHEAGHPLAQRAPPERKTPTGRDPWGPRGTPESPWGGIGKVCAQIRAQSREPTEPAPEPAGAELTSHPDLSPVGFSTISPSPLVPRYRMSLSKLAGSGGPLHGSMGPRRQPARGRRSGC